MNRLAYSVSQAAQLSGVSEWTVRQAVKRGEIRSKRLGRRVLLSPEDVERVFGFGDEEPDSDELALFKARSLAEIRDLLQ